jgi:hypothetical protein
MGNIDRANHDVSKHSPHAYLNGPKPPDNGAAHRAELLDIDMRERALELAIQAMGHGLTPEQRYTDFRGTALATAKSFYAFLKGEPQ